MSVETERNIVIMYAKIAGFSYITFTICGLIKNFLLNTRLSDIKNDQAIGMFVNETHFRFGVGLEALMFLATLLASVALYVVLRSVNKQLAQLSICLRLCEVIFGGFAVIASMTMLALSTKPHLLAIFSAEELRKILELVSSLRMPAYEYSWIFMGFAGVITFYLFFRSRYIPRFWAVWGMLTYLSLIVYPMAKILIPNLPKEVMYVIFPGALFELGVGIWLLTVKVSFPSSNHVWPKKINQQDAAGESAA